MSILSIKSAHQWPIVLAGLGLITLGGVMARNEAAPYLWGAGTLDTQFQTLRDESVTLPASIHGTRVATDTCLTALTGLRATFRPAADREVVRSRCLSLMEDVVAAMPSDSYAWYAGALMHFQAGDVEAANHWLSLSQRTAPTEQWIVEVRVSLAEDNFDQLDANVVSQHLEDLALLAASNRGVASIARRYIDDAGFRERVTAVVETLAPDVQQTFLYQVRLAADDLRS